MVRHVIMDLGCGEAIPIHLQTEFPADRHHHDVLLWRTSYMKPIEYVATNSSIVFRFRLHKSSANPEQFCWIA